MHDWILDVDVWRLMTKETHEDETKKWEGFLLGNLW